MHLVKIIHEVPLISVLGLFGSRNTHCLQKGYHMHTNNFFELACLKKCRKPTFHLWK